MLEDAGVHAFSKNKPTKRCEAYHLVVFEQTLKKGDKRLITLSPVLFTITYSLTSTFTAFTASSLEASGTSTISSSCLTSKIASAILDVINFTARFASSFAGIT